MLLLGAVVMGGCVGERLGDRLRMGGECVLKHCKEEFVLSQLCGDPFNSYCGGSSFN